MLVDRAFVQVLWCHLGRWSSSKNHESLDVVCVNIHGNTVYHDVICELTITSHYVSSDMSVVISVTHLNHHHVELHHRSSAAEVEL